MCRLQKQLYRRAQLKAVNSGELGDERANGRLRVQERVRPGNFGKLHLALNRYVSGVRLPPKRARAHAYSQDVSSQIGDIERKEGSIAELDTTWGQPDLDKVHWRVAKCARHANRFRAMEHVCGAPVLQQLTLV